MSEEYVNADWAADLQSAGFGSFEDWWQAPVSLVDDRNVRGAGWSEVGYLDLPESVGRGRVYVKRQQNYLSRTPRHPVQGEPTFAKEFRTIRAFREAGVGTLQPVYYRWHEDGRSILVTEELKGYRPLDEWLQQWHDEPASRPAPGTYWRLIEACADLVAAMHAHGWHHRCLYPKHLFVRIDGEHLDVRVIDLEKARNYGIPGRWRVEELAKLWRRSEHVSRTDGLRFLLRYLHAQSLDGKARRMASAISRRASRKKS